MAARVVAADTRLVRSDRRGALRWLAVVGGGCRRGERRGWRLGGVPLVGVSPVSVTGVELCAGW